MLDPAKKEALLASPDMLPVDGRVVVDVPLAVFWECFTRPNAWPLWNNCFYWVRNRDLQPGAQLIWVFEPIRRQYLYKMPAIAKIVEREEGKKVTWEVSALPGFYALHTYYMDEVDGGKTRFGSWEQATGWSFRLTKPFWVAHFAFVNKESLLGAKRLETVYRHEGSLSSHVLERMNRALPVV